MIWDLVLDQSEAQVAGSWSYYAFLTIAVMLASVAVVTDSAILVVGAMVVGPEFGVVAALAVGLALRRAGLSRRALSLLVRSFAVAIGIALACALAARAVGWVHPSSVSAARPLTGFIWRPDRWSAVVAVIAGCAGVLSQTAGRTNALVGVFISVTTVPAAGDLALSLAVWNSAPDPRLADPAGAQPRRPDGGRRRHPAGAARTVAAVRAPLIPGTKVTYSLTRT